MSKKRKASSSIDSDLPETRLGLKEETLFTIYGIGCLVLALFFILAYFNTAGLAGIHVKAWVEALFGIGYVLLPLVLTMQGIAFFKSIRKKFSLFQLIGSLLFIIGSLGIIHTIMHGQAGLIGRLVSTPLIKAFDFYATLSFLAALLIISVMVIFDTHLRIGSIISLFKRTPKTDALKTEEIPLTPIQKTDPIDALKKKNSTEDFIAQAISKNDALEETRNLKVKETKKTDDEFSPFLASKRFAEKPYIPPPLSLLEKDRGKPGVGDIKANANTIQRTLQNFGITVEMDEISIGPSVTRYALKPAEGVKVSRIAALQNDLSLALAAHPIRIEAPIPGKSLVGIEIPNTSKTTVGLATLLGEEEFQNSNKPLLVALGKGVSGKSHFANLAKAPHLLIAGATGAGKSVTIHAVLTSLLYRNSPEQLKFLMIDPKRVELTVYNNIPHLYNPVITDAKKAIKALQWAAREMTRRYDLFEQKKVRDIESYHKNILIPELERLGKQKDSENIEAPETVPYIVIVIDELADIMQAYPRELEAGIVRLAQMSRAVGIHLILSTQRPSVNVITGLIKANVPSRIALRVTSQIDSRTILDVAGAEKLLGAGDMLFVSSDTPQANRIQSAFISETELKNVVKYLTDNYKNEIPSQIDLAPPQGADKNIFSSSFDSEDGEIEQDELYEEAKEVALGSGKISTSFLQRKFSIGYSRAAKIIDQLEANGIVGPSNGSKGRDVIQQGDPVQNQDTIPDDSTDNLNQEQS